MAHRLLDFYRGGANDRGVTLAEIWAYTDAELEGHHDFIQWLFPLKTASQFNLSAPVTDEWVIAAFKQDKSLQDKMLRSFDVMLKFYGFVRTGEGIAMGPRFDRQAANWLHAGNHNFLRITRILTSLSLHGLEGEAKAFLQVLTQVYEARKSEIGARTFSFWQSAIQ